MVDEPVKMKKFEIPQEFRNHVDSLANKVEIEQLCERVGELVGKLGISDLCSAFVTDGDLAISWKDYWDRERREAKSASCFHVT